MTTALSLPATAQAHHQEATPFPVTYALGFGNEIPCSGQITGAVRTPHDRPGVAIVSVSWMSFFDSPCPNTVFINYADTSEGQGGTRTIALAGAPGTLIPSSGEIVIPMASGRASLTVTAQSLSSTLLDPAGSTVRFVVA